MFLFDEDTLTFTEWRQYTNPDTNQSGWISDGGQVRYNDPRSADQTTSGEHAVHVDGLTQGLEQKLPEGTWAKIKDKALTVATIAYTHLLRATPAINTLLAVLPDVLDEPKDLNKIGYAPLALGSATANQIAATDPVRANLGISAHTASVIATHVLSRLFVFAKNRLAARTQQMADDRAAGAQWLYQLLSDVANQLGLPQPDLSAVTQAVSQLSSVHVDRMSDDQPASQPAASVTASDDKKPASSEVALPGKDGAALSRLIRGSTDHGIKLLSGIVRGAIKRYGGVGPLLNHTEMAQLAESLAAVNSTADLLGRARVREMADRAATVGSLSRFADDPLTGLDDFGVMQTPQAAVDYFLSLVPTLGIDPQRYIGQQRRQAFTLAASANQALTNRIQNMIAEGMRNNVSRADTTARIQASLDAAGVSTRNPQYAEMVYRTNAMDSFQTGMYEEGRAPAVAHMFPVWQYLGINDHRAGADHRPKFDKFYPAEATFAQVRGNRPYNCRCSMRWVDRYEWEELRASGHAVETNW